MTGIVLFVTGFVPTYSRVFGNSPQPPYYLEDAYDGLIQLLNNRKLLLFSCLTFCAMALFELTGVTITRSSGAIIRSLLDLTRTVLVWLFSLCIGWQKFHILQVRLGIPFLVAYPTCTIIQVIKFLKDDFSLPSIIRHRFYFTNSN